MAPLLHPGSRGSLTQLLPPVPRASCRDCELQDTSSSKEVLDMLCASDFGEPLVPSTPYTPLQVGSLQLLAWC